MLDIRPGVADPNSLAHTLVIPETSKGLQFLAAKYYGHISGITMGSFGQVLVSKCNINDGKTDILVGERKME